jgi:hypothetical protein
MYVKGPVLSCGLLVESLKAEEKTPHPMTD